MQMIDSQGESLAAERGVQANFLVQDALTLKGWSERFDNVIDTGLLHGFSDDDRSRYVEGPATVLKPGGRPFLLCFSDEKLGRRGRGEWPGRSSRTSQPGAGSLSP